MNKPASFVSEPVGSLALCGAGFDAITAASLSTRTEHLLLKGGA